MADIMYRKGDLNTLKISRKTSKIELHKGKKGMTAVYRA